MQSDSKGIDGENRMKNKLKWVQIGGLAQKFCLAIKDAVKSMCKENLLNCKSAEELIDLMEKEAKLGNIPDPEIVEKMAEDKKDVGLFLLASLIHREFARYLAAKSFEKRVFIDETFGAYVKAIGLLLGVFFSIKDERIRDELVRSLAEIEYVANKLGSEKDREYTKILRMIVLLSLKVLDTELGDNEL